MLFGVLRVAVAIGATSAASSHLGSALLSDPHDFSDIIFALNFNLPSLDTNEATSVEKLDRKFIGSLSSRPVSSTVDPNEQPTSAAGPGPSSSATLFQGAGPFSARLVRAKSLVSIPSHSRDSSAAAAVFSMELLQRLCQSYSSGLLEVQALHFTLHSASEGVSLVDLNPLSGGATAGGARSETAALVSAAKSASAAATAAAAAVELPGAVPAWSTQLGSDWGGGLEDLLVYDPLSSTQAPPGLDSTMTLFPTAASMETLKVSSSSLIDQAFLASSSFADVSGANASASGGSGAGNGGAGVGAGAPSAASLTLIEKLKTIKAATSKTAQSGASGVSQQQQQTNQTQQQASGALSSHASAPAPGVSLPTIVTHSASDFFSAPIASAPTLGTTPIPGTSTLFAALGIYEGSLAITDTIRVRVFFIVFNLVCNCTLYEYTNLCAFK